MNLSLSTTLPNSEPLRLVRPAPRWLASYREACEESWGAVHDPYILHDPARFEEWKETIFTDYRDHEQGRHLPEGHTPSATFWAVVGERVIASANIRLTLNDFLRQIGGRFGLFVRSSERRRGYAGRILPMMLDVARSLGITEELLVCCAEENTASLNTLLKSSYKRTASETVVRDGRIYHVRRFFYD